MQGCLFEDDSHPEDSDIPDSGVAITAELSEKSDDLGPDVGDDVVGTFFSEA
jgi:hypothetical protein